VSRESKAARIDRITAETGRPYAEGGAFSSGHYADWRGCVALLVERGLSDEVIDKILRSKHMRWCSDASAGDEATVADVAAYLDKMSPADREEMGIEKRDHAREASAARIRAAVQALEVLCDDEIEAVRAKLDGALAGRRRADEALPTRGAKPKRAKHPEGGKR
jgi:hypothetical protein